MADDYLPSGPLDGSVTFMASQYDPETGRWRRRRITVGEVAAYVLAGQAAGEASLGAALAAEIQARRAGDAAEARARGDADTAQSARLAAIEARPEEVAAFVALAKLPAITALLPVTLTLIGLVPARAGDVLHAGERVAVAPAVALPSGLNIAASFVPADGIVSVQLTSGVTLAAGTTPVVWNITALR